MNLDKYFPKNLYQSYIIEADVSKIFPILLDYLLKREDINEKEGDIFYKIYDAISIDDVSTIKDWHNNKSLNRKSRFCVLGASFINKEAEQSLLKILEEPNKGTFIFIIIPNPSVLNKTILSRVHVVKINNNIIIDNDLIYKFINLNQKEKIIFLNKFIDENKDDNNNSALRAKSIDFINNIISYLHISSKNNIKIMGTLEELEKNKKYLNNPGASVKMILEHIGLVI